MMDAELIKTLTREYLKQLGRGEVSLPQELISEYLVRAGERFSKPHKPKFTLRMSNLGRPTCQLWHEKHMTPPKPQNAYQRQFTFMMGDVSELWLVMVMKAAGVPVTGFDMPVSVELDGHKINGTLDLEIANDTIYDIKAISSSSFKKYTDFGGFSSFIDDDPFGYIEQGVLYGMGSGKKFGGWLLINKNTGDIDICEVPYNFSQYNSDAIARATRTVHELTSDTPFEKQFTDEPELFYKKPTGNRILGRTCGYCDYLSDCWPNAVLLKAQASTAKEPKLTWYTYLEKKIEDDRQE